MVPDPTSALAARWITTTLARLSGDPIEWEIDRTMTVADVWRLVGAMAGMTTALLDLLADAYDDGRTAAEVWADIVLEASA